MLLTLSLACSTARSSPADTSALLPVTLPDLSRVDRAVQDRARQRYATLLEKMHAGVPPVELGAAYGEFGMLLQAADYYEAAEPCLLNAQTLVPGDPRWAYYLGHLNRSRGELWKARANFNQVLSLHANDLATLIWLGRVYRDLGDPANASKHFTRATEIDPEWRTRDSREIDPLSQELEMLIGR